MSNVKKSSRIYSLALVIVLLNSLPAIAADSVTILSSQPTIGSVDTVPNIWKGDIPTKVGYPSGTYSQKLEFPIEGLLPYKTLADRATGVEVEFEIWSQAGKKIAYDTVYTFDWNPLGPKTLVSMYLNEADAAGSHTFLIRTIYELSTTGLLTRYLKSEVKIPIQISVFSKPSSISSMNANWGSDSMTYSFVLADSRANQDFYEVGFQYLLNSTSDKTKYANYSQMFVLKKVNSSSFQLSYEEIINWTKDKNLDVEKSTIMVRVRGVNSWGVGEWGYGLYTDTTNFNRYYQNILAAKSKADAEAKAKAEAEAKAKAEVERKAKLPSQVQGLSGNIGANGIDYKFEVSNQLNTVDSYEIGISRLIYPDSNPSILSNFNYPNVIKRVNLPTFTLDKTEIEAYLKSENKDPSKSTILIRVRAINSFGEGDWSNGVYTETVRLFPIVKKNSTITCVKGTLTKKVTGLSPKCPTGYKKK